MRRQSFHGGTAPSKHKTLTLNPEEVFQEAGEAIEIAAKKVGLGKDTLWKGQGRIPLFLVRTTGAQSKSTLT